MALYERRLGLRAGAARGAGALGARVRRRRPRADQRWRGACFAEVYQARRPGGTFVQLDAGGEKMSKRSDHDKLADRFAPPRRFRGIRSQVNMFLLTAVIGFAGLLGLIAYKQGMFVQHTNVYFTPPTRPASTRARRCGCTACRSARGGGHRVSPSAASGCAWASTANTSRAARRATRALPARAVGAASIQILPGAPNDRSAGRRGRRDRFIAQKGMADMLDEVRQQLTPLSPSCARWPPRWRTRTATSAGR